MLKDISAHEPMAIDVSQALNLLRSSTLEVEGRLVDASNASLLCTLDDGRKAIYKPIAGERPLWDFPDGNLASREVAAFEISELAGFHLIPPTVLRDGPFGQGAVQLWIDVDDEADLVAFAQSGDDQLRAMALLDAILNNTDRKFGHLLLTAGGELYGCDHGVTLHQEDKLRTVLWQWTGADLTPGEISLLKDLEQAVPGAQLERWITDEEIQALQSRISRLLTNLTMPEPSDDWPAVPWPPY
jgi:hypothetical protein